MPGHPCGCCFHRTSLLLWSVAMPELFLVGSVVANMPPGKFSTESGQSKTGGAGIDVEKSRSEGSDKFIYLTPNEKKRLRQKRYRLRKASSDDFKDVSRIEKMVRKYGSYKFWFLADTCCLRVF